MGWGGCNGGGLECGEGEEEEGDEDDQGADGDGGLRPGEDVGAVDSRGGFQGGRRRGRRRREEILLLVDNGVVFREEDQKKTHTPAFATALGLGWDTHLPLSISLTSVCLVSFAPSTPLSFKSTALIPFPLFLSTHQ